MYEWLYIDDAGFVFPNVKLTQSKPADIDTHR